MSDPDVHDQRLAVGVGVLSALGFFVWAAASGHWLLFGGVLALCVISGVYAWRWTDLPWLPGGPRRRAHDAPPRGRPPA